MRGRRVAAVGLAAVVSAALWAPPAGAAGTRVKVKDNFFKPKRVTVEVGTRVKWVNRGGDAHTTTSKTGLWDEELAPGDAFRRKFKKAGTFRYYCRFHDDMRGKIIVVA